MWPYHGKRANIQKNGQFDFTNIKGHPMLTKTPVGEPDKEYYKRLTMSVSVGLRGFPANKIAADGRIVRQYGINEQDVTDQFLIQDQFGTRTKITQRQNQLHNRNVSQLKVVLNMANKERKDSLSQITGAIIRNEVVPPLSQLNNDEFLNEHLKKSTSNLQNKVTKLPPLARRVSIENAKKLEQMAHLVQSEEYNKYITVDDNSDEQLDDDGLPNIQRRLNRRDNSEHFNVKGLAEKQPMYTNAFRRRKSVGLRYGLKGHQNKGEGNASKISRKDSVGLLTESIREQFKSALKNQQTAPKSEQENKTPALSLTGCVANESIAKKIPRDSSRSISNGYKLRHEYGKNLEKNWFKNQFMKKQSRDGNSNGGYDLRLSIFYSPEPQSDGELEDSDPNDESTDDEASMQCGGFSTATAEIKSRRQHIRLKSLRQSLDAHEDIDEQSDGDSSNTDIEIILKDNKLIQRKTKHKMRKKRQRQMERYRAFLPPEMDAVREQQETSETVPLTDQEIRALRLNLKNKERVTCLKGKRKFIQIVNAVYAIVLFRNILSKIRQRKRQLIKKRQQKIAQMVAKKLAKKVNDSYEESQRMQTPKPTLKDQFMKEVGEKLIFDVGRLKIPSGISSDSTDSNTDTDSDNNATTSTKGQENKPEPQKQTKYELELRKVSLTDVMNFCQKVKKRKQRRHRKRRHSLPKSGSRPHEFTVEIPVKPKQRRSRSGQRKQKDIRRPISPPVPKCSCYRVKLAAAAANNAQKCPHQPDVKKPKMKTIKIQTGRVMRSHSLQNISKMRPIELRDLLADIDIPAKEIKLQILARKFRRQRKKRQQIRLSPCRIPERAVYQEEESDNDMTDSVESEEVSDDSDYDFVYGGPFVGSGVMWNQNSKDIKRRTWTDEDVDIEVRRISRMFHEMKECTYLRLDGFNDAIMKKLRGSSLMM